MTDRFLCGWRIRSTISLPELAAWHGEDRIPDVEITLGKVPPPPRATQLDNAELSGASLEVAEDGTAVLDILDVGRFMISSGTQVIVEPRDPADDPAIRMYLLGTILAVLSYQRGFLPLHASCLTIDSGAVAIAGDSGVGKSTLAATLALRGISILADDVCVVDASAPHGPLVWPSVSRIKLWRDALDRLDIPAVGLEQVRRGIEKYSLCDVPGFQTGPVPLTTVYHLTRTTEGHCPRPQAVSGFSAVKLLHKSVYRSYIGKAIGCEHDMAKSMMSIVAAVPILHVSHDPESVQAVPLSDMILQHRRSGSI